jgi:hypothetical protein
MTHNDKQFLESLRAATGRDVQFGNFRCDMCGGHGFSMFEPICTQCYADGETREAYFTDCECRVEKDDNPDCEKCFPEEIEAVSAAA